MSRVCSLLGLAAILVLLSGSVACAAPSFPMSQAGDYYIFAELSSDYGSADDLCFLIGSGFALDEELTLGAQIQSSSGQWGLGGFFAYTIRPLAFNIDVRWAFPGLTLRADALYLLDVSPVKAGVGVGALVHGDDFLAFVEGTFSYEFSRGVGLYAAYEYVPDNGDSFWRVGASYLF